MLPGIFGLAANVVRRAVVRPEVVDVRLRVCIADRFISEVAQCLMLLNRPGDLFVHVRSHHLRAPVAMIGANQTAI